MSVRPMRFYAVYGFSTTHDALAAESVLKRASVPVTPIPAPRALGSLCGIALRVETSCAKRVEDLLVEEGPPWAARIEMEDL